MRIVPALVLSALMIGTANADWCDGGVPPDRYLREPTVEWWVEEMDRREIMVACRDSSSPLGSIGGCAIKTRGSLDVDGELWIIVILSEVTDAEYECILEHEKAHLPPNNWDHGPEWRSYQDADGRWRMAPNPKYRRPIHWVKRD